MARRRKADAASKARAEFVSEAEEILERMRDDLSALAEAVAGQREAAPDTVNRLFRSAHSLKGLSGLFGHESLGELAHHLEDILDRLRMGRATLDAAGLALFDEAIGAISHGLEMLGADAATDDAGLADLVARIGRWTQAPAPAAAPSEALELPASLLGALTEYEEHRLRENLQRGRGVYVIEAEFELSSFEEGLAELSAAIREVGEVLSTLPSPGGRAEGGISFALLVASELSAAEIEARQGLAAGSVHVGRAAARPGSHAPEAAVSRLEPAEPAAPEVLADAAVETHEAAADQTLKSISDTVRVDIKKLDELMNLVGELALQRSALRALIQRLASDPATARVAREFDKVHRGLDRKLAELQAGVLDVRMVPLRQVFDRLARVVRRLRVDLHKEVRLEIAGADTELDKLIIEQLVDPLMHLVRNAFDHAIEPAAERAAAGKPAEGCIRIEASQRGNDVAIAVRDDGRGIDVEAVQRRAAERGLIAAGDVLTRREALDLIFAPGLSTRMEVTETSGRGVGMDVVRANVAAMGGLVDLASTPGQGTTVTLTLPITLAIIQALVVGAGEQRFAIPLGSIRETLIVGAADVQRSHGREFLSLRGDALPLRRLAEEFSIASPPTPKSYVVVLGVGDARVGLLVDRLEGQQDTVIKPIQGPLRQIRGIAGATELGDQTAVLMLDVSALVEDVVRTGAPT